MRLLVSLSALSAMFLSVFTLYGQSTNQEPELPAASPASRGVTAWKHSYIGVWQNMHPLEIELAFDGTSYTGTLHLLSSDTKFGLEGYAQDGQMRLQEIDNAGNTSGYLIVQISEGRMTGQWLSVDFSRSADLSLRDETVVELRRFEPDLLALEGTLDQQTIRLIVQREEFDLLSGYCSLTGDESLYRMTGRCEDAVCDQMTFEMISPNGEKRTLHCSRQRGQAYRFDIVNEAGHEISGSGSLVKKYPMHRQDIAGYIGNIDCMYPALSIPAFDSWVKSQFGSWFDRMSGHLDSLRVEYEVPGPAERWSVQASAWIDITLITSEAISGLLTMYEPVQHTYVRSAFIFEVRSGKLEEVRDLGRKSDFRHLLETSAANAYTSSLEEDAYLEWVKGQTFKHIAITSNCFVLFTDYDPAYGDAWETLSYTEVRDVMKRNALVLNLWDN